MSMFAPNRAPRDVVTALLATAKRYGESYGLSAIVEEIAAGSETERVEVMWKLNAAAGAAATDAIAEQEEHRDYYFFGLVQTGGIRSPEHAGKWVTFTPAERRLCLHSYLSHVLRHDSLLSAGLTELGVYEPVTVVEL